MSILLNEHKEKVLFRSIRETFVPGKLDAQKEEIEQVIEAVVTPPKVSEVLKFTSGGNKIDIQYKVRTTDKIAPQTGDMVVIDGEDFFVKQVKGYRQISDLKTMYVGRTD